MNVQMSLLCQGKLQRRMRQNYAAMQSKLSGYWEELTNGKIRCTQLHDKVAHLFVDAEESPSTQEPLRMIAVICLTKTTITFLNTRNRCWVMMRVMIILDRRCK